MDSISYQGPVRTLVASTTPHVSSACTAALKSAPGVSLQGVATSVGRAITAVRTDRPSVAVLENTLLAQDHSDSLIQEALQASTAVLVVVPKLERAFALKYLRCGVRGFVKTTATPTDLVRATRGVAGGEVWVPRDILYEAFTGAQEEKIRQSGVPVLNQLTPREQEVMACLREGLCDKDIARRLGISHKTVKSHMQHIFKKTKLHSRLQLAVRG